MLTVNIYGPGDDCLGSWYPEDDQVQVPRKGDIVWIQTDKLPHGRWRVANVQWSFRDYRHGIGHTRMIAVEVHVRRYSTRPLWRRFVELFPAAA